MSRLALGFQSACLNLLSAKITGSSHHAIKEILGYCREESCLDLICFLEIFSEKEKSCLNQHPVVKETLLFHGGFEKEWEKREATEGSWREAMSYCWLSHLTRPSHSLLTSFPAGD